MEFIARVNPKYFAAINLFAAAQDIRYYLNGVFIEPHPEKGVVIVATNGHVLGLIHDPDGWCAKPVIVGGISKPLISACAKAKGIKGLDKQVTLYISERSAVVHAGEQMDRTVDPFSEFTTHMSKIEIIDAKYPDYRRVIPNKREPSEQFPCMNASYFAILDKVGALLVPGIRNYGAGVYLESRGKDTSVVARFTQGDLEQRFVAILMPMSGEGPKEILPVWMMPKEEPATV